MIRPDAITGLGDIVTSVAQPIARGVDSVFGTNIQNCGGCQKRREKLNELFPLTQQQINYMTTKFQVIISITDDDNIIVEGRTRQGTKTKVLKKDKNINASVGEAVMSFAPEQTGTGT